MEALIRHEVSVGITASVDVSKLLKKHEDVFLRQIGKSQYWTTQIDQLIVRDNQEAVFYCDGKPMDSFGPGRYTLSTQNIPFISRILSSPTINLIGSVDAK